MYASFDASVMAHLTIQLNIPVQAQHSLFSGLYNLIFAEPVSMHYREPGRRLGYHCSRHGAVVG